MSGDDGDIDDDQSVLSDVGTSSRGKRSRHRTARNPSINSSRDPEDTMERSNKAKHKIYTPKHRHVDDNEFKVGVRYQLPYPSLMSLGRDSERNRLSIRC